MLLLVPRTSITPVVAWSWPTWVVESETCFGSCVRLVGVPISFEKNFYQHPFTPPSLVHLIGPSIGIRAGSVFIDFSKSKDPKMSYYEGPIRRTREGGRSEWESIKNFVEGDGDSNKTNTASNTRLRQTTQVGQAHVAPAVPLHLGTNKQPFEPKHTNSHIGNLHGLLPVLHQSDRWSALVRPATPVRPVDRAGQAGGYSSHTTSVPESLSDFSRPWNKNTPKTQPARKENPTQNLANNSKQTKN
jgi:hypothetical protein